MIMWDMHDHTTKEQAKLNREKALATSTDRSRDGATGQVHRGQRPEECDSSRNSNPSD